MTAQLHVDMERLAEFSERNRVSELAVFGSCRTRRSRSSTSLTVQRRDDLYLADIVELVPTCPSRAIAAAPLPVVRRPEFWDERAGDRNDEVLVRWLTASCS